MANDPALKAKGVRCTFQDNLVNVFGSDPKTGVARNPFDNIGVQYGLKALNDGKITFDQFMDINTRIGGHDNDGKIVPQRTVGDAQAIRRARLPASCSKSKATSAATSATSCDAAAVPTTTSRSVSTHRIGTTRCRMEANVC